MPLSRGCPPANGQTAWADVPLTKGIHENSRATFPPCSQAPPVATRRKSLRWPYSPALAEHEAHSPEPEGSCPSWVCPHCKTTSSVRSQLMEGTVTPGERFTCLDCSRQQAKGSGPEAQHVPRLVQPRPRFCCCHTQSDGAATTAVSPLPVLCTSPSSCQHPHRRSCQGHARVWMALIRRYNSTAQLPQT